MYVPHERRALILRLLEQRGYLRSAELARELGVTDETIRTDLIALHEQRLLTRVHGGARYVPPTGGTEDATRLDCQLIEHTLRQLHPGSVIYLDAGTLASLLLSKLGGLACTILTPSPRMLMQLAAKAMPQQGIIPGGELDKDSQLISAAAATSFFAERRPDAAVLCPQSLPAPGQIAYRHATRAAWAEAAALAARRTIIATPAHAFYTQAAHSVPCTPHLLITEDNLPPGYESIPAELLPYLSPADLRQEGSFASSFL